MKIVPLEELKDIDKVSEYCVMTCEPVVFTKDGRGHLVVQSIDSYNKLEQRLKNLRDELDQVRAEVEKHRP